MTKTLMYTESALPKRSLTYKTLAVAFSYPDDEFFRTFPELSSQKESLRLAYDRFFRLREIWLYGTEYSAENEFQRVRGLADISGFYKAFAVEVKNERPDSLASELEFMHYLIFKQTQAPDKEKASVCHDAQKKFFSQHLYPAAKKIAEKIISQIEDSFYLKVAKDMLAFLESEKNSFNR